MRLPRMTTRRWMIAVLVVGLAMVVYRLKRRHDCFTKLAYAHAQAELSSRQIRVSTYELLEMAKSRPVPAKDRYLAEILMLPYSSDEEKELLEELSDWDKMISFHEALAEKYRHAARRPWLPLPRDPQRPETSINRRRQSKATKP